MSEFEFIYFRAWSDKNYRILSALMQKITAKANLELPVFYGENRYDDRISMCFPGGLDVELIDNEGVGTRLQVIIRKRIGQALWQYFIECGIVTGGPFKKSVAKSDKNSNQSIGQKRKPAGRPHPLDDVWAWKQIHEEGRDEEAVRLDWYKRISDDKKRNVKDPRNRFLRIIKRDWLNTKLIKQ